MDRKRPIPRLLTGCAFLLLLGASSDAPLFPVAEARWMVPDALERALLILPSECLALPADPNERRKAEIGRIAFRAPLLLGGQAARAGLSCASCHRNGRANPHFSFPGVSGAPGTADVTSSLMSKHRGDGTINPKPIPDLAAPASGHIVTRDPSGKKLEQFIRGLIVEEFDGPEPPPAVLDGLAAYVRALRPEACAKDEPLTLQALLSETKAAVDAASEAFAASDTQTALLMIGAARSTLGRIDERFRLPGLEPSRRLLQEADGELRTARYAADPVRNLRLWTQAWSNRARKLKLRGSRSLFAPAILKQHLPDRSN